MRYTASPLLLPLLLCSLVRAGAETAAEVQIPEADAGMIELAGFSIDRFEFPNTAGALPTVGVSWNEAQKLCSSRGKRLCSEREWEIACRGPENYRYGYGNEYEPRRCNVPFLHDGRWIRSGPSVSGLHVDCVSSDGVQDMIGNVWEWTDGWYDADRRWRVVRGGSWFNNVNFARVGGRYGLRLTPDYRLDLIGFRCCRTTPSPEGPVPP